MYRPLRGQASLPQIHRNATVGANLFAKASVLVWSFGRCAGLAPTKQRFGDHRQSIHDLTSTLV
ncbi:hypothetical protein AFK24_19085 [Pseudomonas syringae]|uniref:Uncharacterized protein n=1 Tax=Pseudomonas syringae TaxID=317 RepID=A0A1C7Z124_PSESX|nr:hypothetical protein AFK24_19085 [Pseudomonas syringae]